MGSYLYKLLSNSNIQTYVTSRQKARAIDGVEFIEGNARDGIFLQEILAENWDVIVDFMVYSTAEFKNRVDSLLRATKQYVFLSSARVYNNSFGLIHEDSARLLDSSTDSEFLNTDEYSLQKARQEDILYSCGIKNWTIVRPYITYGSERLQLGVLEKEEWLYRAIKGRTIFFSADMMSKLTTMTHGADVAKGIFSILGTEDSLGETFHITSNLTSTWSEILDVYLDVLQTHLGFRPKVSLESLGTFLKCRPGEQRYQVIYDRLFDRSFDNSRIDRYLRVREFTSVSDGLKACLQDFLLNPKFGDINWKAEAQKDRLLNERTPLAEIAGIKQKIKYTLFRYFLR